MRSASTPTPTSRPTQTWSRFCQRAPSRAVGTQRLPPRPVHDHAYGGCGSRAPGGCGVAAGAPRLRSPFPSSPSPMQPAMVPGTLPSSSHASSSSRSSALYSLGLPYPPSGSTIATAAVASLPFVAYPNGFSSAEASAAAAAAGTCLPPAIRPATAPTDYHSATDLGAPSRRRAGHALFDADAASPYVPCACYPCYPPFGFPPTNSGAVHRPLSDRLAAQLAPDSPLLRLILQVSSDSLLLNEAAVDKLPVLQRSAFSVPCATTLWLFSSLFAVLDAHMSLSECKDFTALHRAVELAHIGAGDGGGPRRRGIAAGKPTGALLRYAGTPDLVPLVLRTCGIPRTQREALLLLLVSMINADEPVDAAGFHTHATANPDVEWSLLTSHPRPRLRSAELSTTSSCWLVPVAVTTAAPHAALAYAGRDHPAQPAAHSSGV
ncbi:hypothetical protein HK405_010719, partial [Cladochytrium tenue]